MTYQKIGLQGINPNSCQWVGVVCHNVTSHVHELHLSVSLGSAFCAFLSRCFFLMCLMHYIQDPQVLFSAKTTLKLGPTALFTHLKIILIQCFHISIFSKISYIRTNPTYFDNLTIDYKFFLFIAHMSVFVIIGYYLLYDA